VIAIGRCATRFDDSLEARQNQEFHIVRVLTFVKLIYRFSRTPTNQVNRVWRPIRSRQLQIRPDCIAASCVAVYFRNSEIYFASEQ
jgi:hypothetical protein